MQSENKMVIVIPVYKIALTQAEIISLQRILMVLSKYDFSLACAHSLNEGIYENYFKKAGVKISIEKFDDSFFKSIEGYNRLMLSTKFYSRFKSWDYMLIYQLDCFIFKDDIERWLEGEYDYIGSPWPHCERQLNFYKSLLYSRWSLVGALKKRIDFNQGKKIFVGNGGFSIRKIRKFENISQLLHLFFKKHLGGHVNEDYIWSILVTKYFSNFKIPSVAIASKFALEETMDPINLDIETLPMASHAWERYYPELWQSVILKFSK